MSRKPVAILLALAVGALAPQALAQAQAQNQTPGQAARPAPVAAANPEAEVLVRRYLAAVHFEKTMDALQGAMLPAMTEQLVREHPELSADDRAMVIDVVRKEMRDKVMPAMIERFVPIYAATFSMAELKALVAFYESPEGRSITDKMPSLAPRSAEVMRAVMPMIARDVAPEVMRQYCARHGCPPSGAPKTRPS